MRYMRYMRYSYIGRICMIINISYNKQYFYRYCIQSMIFTDISDFTNVNDYLPILNGAINADLIIIFLVFHGFFQSVFLQKWYTPLKIYTVEDFKPHSG